ncbi:hypothetical protein H072_2709 [Dactylellina haptotyla CBS 200.50]|uniref:TRAM domain-containing protein n=1 Tax=Dactylellina haptotyla (strain CBS 200.50) TaxID=1284197 RepID=S8AK76_DACHA|nr:hypothetical protein H072_2709 [Dactylellina haptotyla CBS 200.50]
MLGTKRPSEESGFKSVPPKGRRLKRKKMTKNGREDSDNRFEGSAEEVLLKDIKWLLQNTHSNGTPPSEERNDPPQLFSQLEASVTMLASTGDGLAVSEDGTRVFVIPFTIPGDKALIKVVKNYPSYSTTDMLEIREPSRNRRDDLVFCKYFGKCSGCQFQMLSDDYQLEHKRQVVEKAMKNFSNLEPSLIPPVGKIMPSPLSKGYRTKLTPHFDGPRRGGFKEDAPVPDIGFQLKGRNFVLDIEDCPIGTQPVRDGMKFQREHVQQNLHTFKRGATLLLRESTQRQFSRAASGDQLPHYEDTKSCITDSKAFVTEWVGNFKFSSPAGAFFQNNNSILPHFTDFIREQLYIPMASPEQGYVTNSYLIDAYCGSESAKKNAKENGIQNARFITGNAESIFVNIDFPPEQTSVVIDPPRKGCDELFLSQLLSLSPKRIVYISCNVHTMARDIGWFVQQSSGRDYTIEKLGGFDFFPQTHHVEGYAVLSKSG